MPTYQCVSCGAIYDSIQQNGVIYFHACAPEKVTTRATFDPATGKQLTPEARTPMPNPRNENVLPGLIYVEGKPFLTARDPTDATRQTLTPATQFIIAEGAGRAPYDRATKTAGAPHPGPTVPGT